MQKALLLEKLRILVGRRFRYAGERVTLIDLLIDEETAVLCFQNPDQVEIQKNLYGQASRLCSRTIEIPLFSDNDEYSDEMMFLLENPLID
ncbi:MAG: hypothetical protein KZQ58_05065 [gamma proteobacterium symbiont of Bathyaustriella thionipta]|nr:hypothetical protein [gamma proteobacterium symbiont of Bathyaustriella thionipta]